MKNKVLSTIALITIFIIPLTVVFFWRPDNPNATALLIGYSIFIAFSFCYSLFLLIKKHLKDTNTKIALGVNSLYLAAILILVVIPRLI
ncbi:hypothetical protein SAMN02745136_05777 [Anaerocolumna jejuensis DSM 15929]|uniref:Uncharacterized protein n=1 Tax=Anaerocolumna jejuensis DSM 15929 TaxID=1121322 RepID=A0A1M7DT70_9FIRM|nr:hypothetical protein SAMN02745136_05777 [Anaerocolumna jejuensis DSM 15929]